ncbi:MAG: DUF3592 domain-containing protein [Planctomycetota bacterium]
MKRSTRRSKTAKARRGRVAGALFFSVFLTAGLAFGYFVLFRPMWRVVDARGWPAVPAVVTASDIEHSTDSDGNATYRLDIAFRYEFNGRTHTSDTYSFWSHVSTGGYDGKREIVRRYPVGGPATCYVNPDKPTLAVIERGLTATAWFGLVPLVFVLVGGGGMAAMLWGGSGARGATRRAQRVDTDEPAGSDWLPRLAEQRLRDDASGVRPGGDEVVGATKSRLGKLGLTVGFALFWNGIVSVFVVLVAVGEIPWFVGLFLIPFVLVGLVLVGAVFQALMALANPVVRITFDDGRVIAAGQPMRLAWRIDGRADRLNSLTMTVEGVERASYTRGTDHITEEHVFFSETFHEETVGRHDPMPRDGEAEFVFPEDTMHSFDARNNKIRWRLKLHGDIPRWPDVKDEVEIAVVPPGHPAAPSTRGMF